MGAVATCVCVCAIILPPPPPLSAADMCCGRGGGRGGVDGDDDCRAEAKVRDADVEMDGEEVARGDCSRYEEWVCRMMPPPPWTSCWAATGWWRTVVRSPVVLMLSRSERKVREMKLGGMLTIFPTTDTL